MTTCTPKSRWNLTEVARVTVDGTDYVVYDDGSYRVAIEADDFDAGTEETDYSLWCAATAGVGDRDLARRIAAEAGLDGIYTCGDCTWVEDNGRTHTEYSYGDGIYRSTWEDAPALVAQQTVQTTVTEADLAEAQGGTCPGGDDTPVWVECPDDYDAATITADDVIHDPAIRKVPEPE
ncbi:MAG: hypothetical protein AB7I33_08800 [Gemmatimonadales bacterium]